jgi:hypothetical protein
LLAGVRHLALLATLAVWCSHQCRSRLAEQTHADQLAGHTPGSAPPRTCFASKRFSDHKVRDMGIAGPITFMQVNLATGVDEPGCSAPNLQRASLQSSDGIS